MIEHSSRKFGLGKTPGGMLEKAIAQSVGRRLLQYLPLDFVKDNFVVALPTSTEKKKWGLTCHPDAELSECEARMYILGNYRYGKEDFQILFDQISLRAFKTVAWIEIGFGGFDAFADSPASASWIARLGQYHTSEERDLLVRTKGKQFYEETMARYNRFREKENVYGVSDAFERYGLVTLLGRFGMTL